MMMGVLTEPTFSSFAIRSFGRGIQFSTPTSVREATIKKVFNPLSANAIAWVFPKSQAIGKAVRPGATQIEKALVKSLDEVIGKNRTFEQIN